MARKRNGGDIEVPYSSCPKCDPPSDVKKSFRSGIGAIRFAHYLEFRSTDDLENHIRACLRRFLDPAMGYSFEQWIEGVLSWHRMKRVWIDEDERRKSLPDLRGLRETMVTT